MAWMFALAILAGAVIGVLSGLLGIGGGTMVIPVLRLGFGLPTLASTATSLFTMILTSTSGAIGHIRNHTANIKAGLIIGLAGACFSPLGSMLSIHLGNLTVMLISAVVFIYIAYTMIRRGLKLPKGEEHPHWRDRKRVWAEEKSAREAAKERADKKKADKKDSVRRSSDVFKSASASASRDSSGNIAVAKASVDGAPDVGERAFHGRHIAKDVITAVLIGCMAGFASGFLGIGGGFIIIPLCCTLYGFTMNEASGTSLVAILPLAITGTIAHAQAGQVAFLYGLFIAIGSIPGAYFGARLSKFIAERKLRIIFGLLLVLMTIILVLNEYGLLG